MFIFAVNFCDVNKIYANFLQLLDYHLMFTNNSVYTFFRLLQVTVALYFQFYLILKLITVHDPQQQQQYLPRFSKTQEYYAYASLPKNAKRKILLI